MAEQSITQQIKERLGKYAAMLRDIDNQIMRLEHMESTMTSPKAQRLDGMPHSGSAAGDRMAELIGRKEELEEKIREKNAEERKEHAALAAIVDQMAKPDDKLVIQLRYFDRLGWPEVAETLFGSREDFDDKYDSYMRRTLRIHGTALVELAEINNNERPGE